MVEVRITRDSEGRIRELIVEGHSGAGVKGSDIVCAAVSALAYTAVNALEELAGVRNYTIRDGYIKCTVPGTLSAEKREISKIVLETVAVGFKQIEFNPEYARYIRVVDKEVRKDD